MMTTASSLTSPTPAVPAALIRAIVQAGGWLAFDDYMHWALCAPGQGYYARGSEQLGHMPAPATGGHGSDFVTAPELSALFGWTLAQQVAQALQVTGTDEVWEFGAGTGALADQVLQALQARQISVACYHIVEVSGALQTRQRERLQAFGDQVQWHTALPAHLNGVLLGNELLDAMPVKLLARRHGQWQERGVVLDGSPARLAWQDRPTRLTPPLAIEGEHDYLCEIHLQAEAFVRTVGERLRQGAIFLIDYGFPEAEFYHPQRHMGTLMCHRAHRADSDPLQDPGDKDITAHVNFTGIALAGNTVGLGVLGYCTQARFLMNCGLLQRLQDADLPARVMAQKLIMEHEMGELFKVIGFFKGDPWDALGFALGDRTHTL